MRVTYRNEILMPDSPFACKIDIASVSTYAHRTIYCILHCNVLSLSLPLAEYVLQSLLGYFCCKTQQKKRPHKNINENKINA